MLSHRFLIIIALGSFQLGFAQEMPSIEGHSGHGEAFNEGPRQNAYLMEGVGGIDFPITVSSESGQKFFNQGMCQLHGFWFFEAERSFRYLATIDPDCAMAYWGMAMANTDNEERAQGFIKEAYERRAKATRKEKLFIEALARFHGQAPDDDKKNEKTKGKRSKPKVKDVKTKPSAKKDDATKEKKKPKKRSPAAEKKRRRRQVQDLEALIHEFPDDIEAKAILVNQLWLDGYKGGLPIHSRQANQALLDQVFATSPMHPAHHYRIHLWDTKKTSYRIVDSAVRSGFAAPGIAHLWHMGGHTFSRLERFEDAAWQQEASARVDHAHMMRDFVMPYQIHNYAHNNEWCSRNLRHVGRIHDSISLAKNLVELPRHPKMNRLGKGGSAASYGRSRLIEALHISERWDLITDLGDTMYFEPGEKRSDRATRHFELGRARAMRGELENARTHREGLQEQIVAERAARMVSAEEAEKTALAAKKSEDDVHKAMTKAMRGHARQIRRLETKLDSLNALIDYSEGKREEAIAILVEKKYDNAHLSRLCLEAGQKEKAIEYARKATRKDDKRALPRANLAWVLWECGKREEAKPVFEDLRRYSARFDLDSPGFARLAPMAKELGYDADWRIPYEVPDDVLERPNLTSLGPFHWTPSPAPGWKLQGAKAGTVALEDYRGRPVLVVFFLGFGCVHCVEQLDAIKPLVKDFAGAGIDIVTIGTDKLDQVKTSLENGGGLDFPVLSDPDGEIFKRYRAWDDFENMALHGTFLVDGEGLVRWQDISYEPFMETEFLLAECKRLLALPAPSRKAVDSGR